MRSVILCYWKIHEAQIVVRGIEDGYIQDKNIHWTEYKRMEMEIQPDSTVLLMIERVYYLFTERSSSIFNAS